MRTDRARLRASPIASMMPVMDWTTPAYEELKMDAEIGSYQQDEDVPPFAAQAPAGRPAPDAAE